MSVKYRQVKTVTWTDKLIVAKVVITVILVTTLAIIMPAGLA